MTAVPIPIALIDVPPNRQRSSMDEAQVTALRESMRVVGQIHAITLRRNGDGRYTLIVGERRFRARAGLQDSVMRHASIVVPPGHIAAQMWEDLTIAEQAELELEENIRRVDLSWQDQTRAVQRLNELRQQQATAKGDVYTNRALGQEVQPLGVRPSAPVGDKAAGAQAMLTVAKHLHHPDVAAAKTFKEAVKAVDRIVRNEQLSGMAQVFEAQAAKSTPHRLLRGDCFEVMATLPDSSFDCVVTDPPYGINADEFGDMANSEATDGGHGYDDSEEVFQRIWGELPEQLMRLLAAQGHVYCFCDPRRFIDLKDGFELAGFRVWPWPLIWNKGGRMLPDPKHGPRRAYEAILFANKGQREVEYVANDVISIPAVQSPRHSAEKPVDLIRDLLGRSTRPGSRVLDPFCGSGTIFPAANLAKVAATGIERVEQYANLAASRLTEGHGAQTSLLEAY